MKKYLLYDGKLSNCGSGDWVFDIDEEETRSEGD